MRHFSCPFLGVPVELTPERAAHITARHPELLPRHAGVLRQTVLDPDLVRTDPHRPQVRKLSRCYPHEMSGRNVVVVVIDERPAITRVWIVTAFTTRKLTGGHVAWRRD